MTAVTYEVAPDRGVVIRSDGQSMPMDPYNRDYAEYLAWVADGNTATILPPEPPPVPAISKAQALLWLLSIGKTDADVQAVIATIPDATERAIAQIEWDYRQPFRYDHPLFAALAPALGLTVEQLPDAFRAAAAL